MVIMKCDRCNENIEKGEEREHHGQLLCEDCFMDALSPPRACDPWAVYTAKSLEKNGLTQQVTEVQKKILKLLEQTGGLEPQLIAEKIQLKMSDLERELATLRHMEKVRGELREGKRTILLW
jgi:hypothetical protein